MAKTKQIEELKVRILDQLIKKSSGCWEWQGRAAGKDGLVYGFVLVEGRRVNVRRVVYALWGLKPKLERFAVASTCANPLCVNPKHLYRSEKRKGGLPAYEESQWSSLLKGI